MANINTNDYYYYIHGTNEKDYTKFFRFGLIDYDKDAFRLESTMLRISDEDIANGRLQEIMTKSKDKYGELWDNVFLIKIPKCYFPDHEHRDGTWDVPIPLFYEALVKDKNGVKDTYPILIPNLIQGCYSQEKGFITNDNYCPVFDPSGLKFAYEQIQPMKNSNGGYQKYEQYNKRNNVGDLRTLYEYDKQNKTWDAFVKYYSEKFGIEAGVLFGEDYFDEDVKEETSNKHL